MLLPIAASARNSSGSACEDRRPPATQSRSPVVLTNFEERISSDLDAGSWAVENARNSSVEISNKEEFEILNIVLNLLSRNILQMMVLEG